MANQMLEEKWVVPQYNGNYFHNYLISDLGRLLTNKVSPKNCNKKPFFGNYRLVESKEHNRGYTEVFPYTDEKKRKYLLLHRLVWCSFIGNIEDNYVIDHKNADKKDNRLINLQCITQSQNQLKYHREEKPNKKK